MESIAAADMPACTLPPTRAYDEMAYSETNCATRTSKGFLASARARRNARSDVDSGEQLTSC
eukprot:scaffold149520_cov35-Tisochrysis_lutea.AAC.2